MQYLIKIAYAPFIWQNRLGYRKYSIVIKYCTLSGEATVFVRRSDTGLEVCEKTTEYHTTITVYVKGYLRLTDRGNFAQQVQYIITIVYSCFILAKSTVQHPCLILHLIGVAKLPSLPGEETTFTYTVLVVWRIQCNCWLKRCYVGMNDCLSKDQHTICCPKSMWTIVCYFIRLQQYLNHTTLLPVVRL